MMQNETCDPLFFLFKSYNSNNAMNECKRLGCMIGGGDARMRILREICYLVLHCCLPLQRVRHVD